MCGFYSYDNGNGYCDCDGAMIRGRGVGFVVVGLLMAAPAAAITTTFRIGVCCTDDAGSSGCDATVCDADVDCSGGKVCAGSDLSFVQAVGIDLSPSTWNPVFDSCQNGQTTYTVQKSEIAGVGEVDCGLLIWDTGALSNTLPVVAANLLINAITGTNDDNRNLTADWLDWGVCSVNDWSLTCGTNGFDIDINSLSLGDNIIPLSGLGNISVTGTSSLRLCISGGAPSTNGVNSITFPAFLNTTLAGPALEVEQEDVTPTSTATPVSTSTSTNTVTSTATATHTGTPAVTSTSTNTATVTATPANTSTVTRTGTITTTPTITPTSPPSGDNSGMRGLLASGPGCCCSMGRRGGDGDENLFAQGCYEGTGNDNRKIVTGITDPGFLFVAEKNANPGASDVAAFRIPQSVGDDSCLMINDGDTCRANMIQDQNIAGYFEIGTSSLVNANSDDYCWYQWSIGPNHQTFSYTGDGSGNRTIDVGIQDASFALVKSTANSSGPTYAKSALMTADQSFAWDDHLISEAGPTTRVRNLTSAGVEVGSAFNVTSVVYWGAAWKEGPDYGDNLTWIGNGSSGTGGTCATTADVQTVTTSCSPVRNVMTSQCTLDGCEGEACSTQSPGLAVIRGQNIGTDVVGPGNITGDNFYAQSATRDRDGYLSTAIGEAATFQARGEPNGLNSANDLGATYYGFTTCAPGPTIGTVAPPDWSVGMDVVYHLEEATNATRTNNDCVDGFTGGTFECGFSPTCACNLDGTNTVDQDTTNKVIGSAAASFDGATATDLLTCPFADCGTVLNISGTATWGCFARTTTDITVAAMVFAGTAGSGNASYQLLRSLTTDACNCRVIEADGGDIQQVGTTNDLQINEFGSCICTFDDTANQLVTYSNSVASAAATATDMKSVAAGEFSLGGVGGGTIWNGQLDECFVVDRELSAVDICRIASCGVTGGACSCWAADSTVYIDEGFNDTLGNNCALPVCDKVAPD